MRKYRTHTNEKVAIIEWMKAFDLSDLHDALEEVARKVTTPVPLLVINHSNEFDPPSDELLQIVKIFDKFKNHFTVKVAFIVSKDSHYGLGRILNIFLHRIDVFFVPFRDIWEAWQWLLETPE